MPSCARLELTLLEPIAGRVAGDRYADMSLTSAAREPGELPAV
ncbi:hypothetical protein [Streptomyces lydicus]